MDKTDGVNQSYLEAACNEIVLEREKLEAEDEFNKNLKQVCKDAVAEKRKQDENETKEQKLTGTGEKI